MKDRGQTLAWIGLGSNLDQPITHIRQALTQMQALPETTLERHSCLYLSRPLPTKVAQPPYVNAVALLQTYLDPEALLAQLHALEESHCRQRDGQLNQPRTLDLDVLLYGELKWSSPSLSIPHPRMTQRDFVLIPLKEISHDISIPEMGSINDLIANLDEHHLLGYYDKHYNLVAYPSS